MDSYICQLHSLCWSSKCHVEDATRHEVARRSGLRDVTMGAAEMWSDSCFALDSTCFRGARGKGGRR